MKKKQLDPMELPLPNKKVYELIQEKTNGNVKAFAESIGVAQQSLNRIFSIDKRNDKFPSISNDIKQGIIRVYGKDEIWFIADAGKATENKRERPYKPTMEDHYLLVPIVHIDSVGGMHSQNSIAQEPQYIEGYAPFTDAREGDICIIQSGDSMTPTCPSGSLLLIRKVENWREYLGYGNIFVLELTDGRRITKEITKYHENPRDFVWCISHNPEVPDEELPKSMIVAVWKVIKIQINKGW